MNLHFQDKIASGYKSASQKVRVLTESWVATEAFCPACGKPLKHIENNAPVEDFMCSGCSEAFELKAKKDNMGKVITDGAYRTMMERLSSDTNPNLFLLNYRQKTVNNFIVIPTPVQ